MRLRECITISGKNILIDPCSFYHFIWVHSLGYYTIIQISPDTLDHLTYDAFKSRHSLKLHVSCIKYKVTHKFSINSNFSKMSLIKSQSHLSGDAGSRTQPGGDKKTITGVM